MKCITWYKIGRRVFRKYSPDFLVSRRIMPLAERMSDRKGIIHRYTGKPRRVYYPLIKFHNASLSIHVHGVIAGDSPPLSSPGGGDSHMKVTGMLVVSLRGINCRFWSRLGFTGRKANICTCTGIA